MKDYRANGNWVDLCSVSQAFARIKSSLLAVRLSFEQLDDRAVWIDEPSGNFSVSSAFARITSSLDHPPFWSKAWFKHLIPKINIFFWILLQNKVLTIDNLCKRGFQIPNRCFLCKMEAESMHNLFLHCSFVASIWEKIIKLWHLPWVFPSSIEEFFTQWKAPTRNPMLRILWDLSFPHVAWGL